MNLRNFKLLCIEDDASTQEHLALLLKDQVKDFFQAYDGAQAVEIYKKFKPDIVMTDINIPKLDGLLVAKEIKKLSNDKTPIIVISAFDDKKLLIDAINIGIDRFISKPLDIEILINTLNKIASNLQNKIDLEYMLQKEKEELAQMAHFDMLTNLPNRFIYMSRLKQAISKAEREGTHLTHFFIDIDGFKSINDTYGHQAGDKVLREISVNIKRVIREEDTFARISGDEFSLILENTEDQTTIENVAKKILKATSTPILYGENIIKTTCSIGICTYPANCSSKDEIIRLSDKAMYEAKRLGKSTYRFAQGV